MKLPSIHYLQEHAKKAFIRFPLVILSSLLAVAIGIFLTESFEDLDNPLPYINLLLTAALGIPSFFCLSIFCEKKQFSIGIRSALFLGTSLLLVLIYFYLPKHEATNNFSVPYIRYALFNVIAHLLVSFIPYIEKGKLNGFWNYNKVLFLRFLASLLYSAFLYIGLIIALTALDLLFDIDLHYELYFEFFIIIIGLFNTWFFVAGIPENLDELNMVKSYPKGLKIFVQYVLLSLLILYLVILYVYGGKIMITGNWPKGIVSYLIAVISPLGILTLLLMYPYGQQKGSGWIKKFTHTYYFILVPLIILLFIAIGLRVDDYGLTIKRYGVVILGVWLSIVSLSGIFKNENIKFIPISLSVLLILISFGPWGIFALSESSQSNRLISILEEHELIAEGKVINEGILKEDHLQELYTSADYPNEKLLGDSLSGEIISILDYLDDFHGFTHIQPYLKQNVDSLVKLSMKDKRYVNEARVYANALGFSFTHRQAQTNQPASIKKDYIYYSEQIHIKKVSNYNYLVPIIRTSLYGKDSISSYQLDSTNIQVKNRQSGVHPLQVIHENDTLTLAIDSLTKKLRTEFPIASMLPHDKMTLKASSNTMEVKMVFHYLSFIVKEEDFIRGFNADLYISIKND